MIKPMTLRQLVVLRDYLIHHKSNVDNKVNAIAEHLPIYEPLHVVAMKVNAAIEHRKLLVENSLSEQCSDKDGNIKLNLVLEAVKFRIE